MPMRHTPATTALDKDVWQEVQVRSRLWRERNVHFEVFVPLVNDTAPFVVLAVGWG